MSFFKRGNVFCLKGDVLTVITEYKCNTTDSPDEKLIIDFLDEMRFDTHAGGKSGGYGNIMKNYYNKRALSAPGFSG